MPIKFRQQRSSPDVLRPAYMIQVIFVRGEDAENYTYLASDSCLISTNL